MDYSSSLSRILRGLQERLPQQQQEQTSQGSSHETLFEPPASSASAEDLYSGMVSIGSGSGSGSSSGSSAGSTASTLSGSGAVHSSGYQRFLDSLLGGNPQNPSTTPDPTAPTPGPTTTAPTPGPTTTAPTPGPTTTAPTPGPTTTAPTPGPTTTAPTPGPTTTAPTPGPTTTAPTPGPTTTAPTPEPSPHTLADIAALTGLAESAISGDSYDRQGRLTSFTAGNKKYEITYNADGSITVKSTVTSGTGQGNETTITYKDNRKTKEISTFKNSDQSVEKVEKDFNASSAVTKVVISKTDKNGKVLYSIADENGSGYPNITEDSSSKTGYKLEIKFSANGEPMTISSGQKATIKSDGTVEVIKDGYRYRYSSTGALQGREELAPEIDTTARKVTFPGGETVTLATGETAAMNDDFSVTITSSDGKTVKLYGSDGSKKYEVIDNNGTGLPNLNAGKIKFSDTKSINIPDGAKVTINADGTVSVRSKDSKTETKYTKDGTIKYTFTDNNGLAADKLPNLAGDKVKFSATLSRDITPATGATVTVNADGTVEMKDSTGKVVAKYDKSGNPVSTTTTTTPNPDRGKKDHILSLPGIGLTSSSTISNDLYDGQGRLVSFNSGDKKYELSYASDGKITVKSTVTSGANKDNTKTIIYDSNDKRTKETSTFKNSDKSVETVEKNFNTSGAETKVVLTKKDEKGKVLYSLTDENGTGKPNFTADGEKYKPELDFGNGTKVAIESGQKATIKSDGSAEVQLANGQFYAYTKDGARSGPFVKQPQIDTTNKKITFPNGTTVTLADGETATINSSDYSVTITKGNTKKLYNNDGSRQYTVTDNNSTTAPNLDAAAGKINFSGSATPYTIQKGDTITIGSDGKVTIVNGAKAMAYAANGTLEYMIVDNNGTAADKLPNRDGNKVKFSATKSIEIKNGHTAVINSDQTVDISKGNMKSRYDKDGNLLYTVTDNNGKSLPSIDPASKKIKFADNKFSDAIPTGGSATIDANGNVEIKNSAGTVIKKYNSSGTTVPVSSSTSPTTTAGTSTTTTTPRITTTGTTATISFPGTTTKVTFTPATQTATVGSDGSVTVTSKDGKTIKAYKPNGSIKYTADDLNGTALPGIVDHKLKFANNSTVNIPDGGYVNIGTDSYAAIFSADRKTRTCYSKDGEVVSTTINNNKSALPAMLWNGWIKFDSAGNNRICVGNKETATINADGTVDLTKDNKTTRYSKTGTKLFDLTDNNGTTTLPSFDPSTGKLKFSSSVSKDITPAANAQVTISSGGEVTMKDASGTVVKVYKADGTDITAQRTTPQIDTSAGKITFPGVAEPLTYDKTKFTATRNSDNTVTLKSKDGTQEIKYKADGSLIYDIKDTNGLRDRKSEYPNFVNGKIVCRQKNSKTAAKEFTIPSTAIPEGSKVTIYKANGVKNMEVISPDGKTTTMYNQYGVRQYGVTDNNSSGMPNFGNNKINFGKKSKTLSSSVKDVVINADGTVTITYDKGKVEKYDINGNKIK